MDSECKRAKRFFEPATEATTEDIERKWRMIMLEDFIRIKANLDTQIASVDAEQATIEAEMGASRERYDMHRICIAELEGEIATLEAEIANLEAVLQAQQLDVLLAKGTSLEEEKTRGLQDTQNRIQGAQIEIEARQGRVGDNRTAQVGIQAELDRQAAHLTELQKKRRELEASRRRFDGEHLAAALPVCLEPLASINQRLVSLEAELAEAKCERLVAQERAALSLAEWPNEGAAALAQHGCFEDDVNTQFLKLYYHMMEFCEQHMRLLTGVAADVLARSDLPFMKYLTFHGTRTDYEQSIQRRMEVALQHPRSDPRMIGRENFVNQDFEVFLRWIAQLSNDIAQSHASNQQFQARQLLERAQAALVAQAEAERATPETETEASAPEPVPTQKVGKGRLKRKNKCSTHAGPLG